MNETTERSRKRPESHGSSEAGRYLRFIDWLNRSLEGPLGPPPSGPFEEVVQQVGAATCPVCSRPMAEHRIDHTVSNAVLHCPVGHERPAEHQEPLNELGMPKRPHGLRDITTGETSLPR